MTRAALLCCAGVWSMGCAALLGIVSPQTASAQRSRIDPTPFTHAEFERLAPPARSRAINAMARERWGRPCVNSKLTLAAAGPKAASWHVACDGSGMIDYMLLLPTRSRDEGARFIYCGPSTAGGRACALN
jgi:hypothetical protein